MNDDNVISNFEKMGLKVIEKISSGPYTMYLIKNPEDEVYQIALTRDNQDFFSMDSQVKKSPVEVKGVKLHFNVLSSKVREWRNIYKLLFVSTYTEEKIKKYKRLFDILKIKTGDINRVLGKDNNDNMTHGYVFRIL